MNRTATTEAPAHNVRLHGFVAQVAQMAAGERAALADAIERQDMAELERGEIAKRIKQARKEAGLTQPEMAEALGVIQRTYQNYESVKEPRTPWGLMNDIAKITGKPTEWLIHGDKATPSLMDQFTDKPPGWAVEMQRTLDVVKASIDALAAESRVEEAPPTAPAKTSKANRRAA